MQPAARKLLMASLVAAFVAQTALVYTDDTAKRVPPLDDLALAGRALWHQHNCQTCHQIYGFGGFLGPDLTNAASRLDRTRLDAILTVGSGQMPAFDFTPDQIDAMQAYLAAVDASGVGQARHTKMLGREQALAAVTTVAESRPPEGPAAEGRILFQALCTACHVPLQASPTGAFVAPDLSDVCDRLNRDQIREVLVQGRPDRGMQPTGLSERHQDAVIAFFEWMRSCRDDLCRCAGMNDAESVPWWEYR